jgi:hypothetical protein
MKHFAIPLIFSSFFVFASEPDAPSKVTIDGRMEFMAIDSRDNLLIEKLEGNFSIPKDVTACIFNVIAEDEYFTSYPGVLEFRTFEDETFAMFYRTKALWIDEDSRYWKKQIASIALRIHDLNTDDWGFMPLGDGHAIYASSIESGFALFHYLSMGQPLTISIKKSGNPSDVTINIKPLNAELSTYARECLKALNGEL